MCSASSINQESRDYRLLASICETVILGQEPSPALIEALQSANWQSIYGLAEQHRMTGFLNIFIKTMHLSADHAAALRLSHKVINQVSHNMLLLNTLKHVSNVFSESGISYLCIKGPLLADHLFGDSGIRRSDDLDVMVAAEHFDNAVTILEKHGYSPVHPPEARRFLLQHGWDWPMQSACRRFHIDLKTCLAPGYLCIPRSTVQALMLSKQTRICEGVEFPVPGAAEEAFMLAIHGWKHGWHRLAWIADMAVALRQLKEDEYSKLCKLAAQSRCRMILDTAEKAAGQTFPDLVTVRRSNAGKAGDAMQAGHSARPVECLEFTDGVPEAEVNPSIGKLARHREGITDRGMMRLRWLFEPGFGDWRMIPLPRSFWWLYYPLRVVRLTGRLIHALSSKP